MKYFSLNGETSKISFEESVLQGLAPDKGLYFPDEIAPLPSSFFDNICDMSNEEMAYEAIQPFIGDEINENALRDIIRETLCFDFPCVEIEPNMWVLELFHGPTMAFKDVGARFMARCLGYFNHDKKDREITVLVATSGDTGGAVANGFYRVPGVKVVILYPRGKVSEIQEKQLTTLGENITALEVEGTFDDCQDMVKRAFLDADISFKNLTSANSINVARWLPQMFYYFVAYKKLRKEGKKNISFVVPSGNFGNICAGIVAHKLGIPVHRFVAATNVNDTVPRYMTTQNYNPESSRPTISNAMDVGNPSNFIRVQKLFENNFSSLNEKFSAVSFTDDQTRGAIKSLYKQHNYISDPHGAVGYLGARYLIEKESNPTTVVFLETAHPAKFIDVVEETLGTKIEIPKPLQNILYKVKRSVPITTYKDFKTYLKESV